MAYKKKFGMSSAYGQLIVLVFLPILVLALVGGVLVFYESMRASLSEQQAQAQAVLMRYKPMLSQDLQEIFAIPKSTAALENDAAIASETPEIFNNLTNVPRPVSEAPNEAITSDVTDTSAKLTDLRNKLTRIRTNQHVQRVAIVDNQGQVLLAVGYGTDEKWPLFDGQSSIVNALKTPIGTAYGTYLDEVNGRRVWLMVDMDNEPLHIARYRIALALAITGLLTLLLLLLSLNIYAKRWITPIYELRLQLQRTEVDTLYKPMPIESTGELNLLQQEIVKTLRRLHTSFQELKDHAEQTEDDLRVAFDEMEMQNISIRNARDAAISTSQAKSAFLANISHELRTPLNSIDGFINLLSRKANLSGEQALYVQTIRKSSAHLLALVNDVLDFSKIEAGKLVLDRHEFNLYDAIYDVADMLSPVAAEKRLRMAVLFYDDVPRHIIGDALRLKQVLTNLVGNAIKFTDSGEVLIRVSLDDYKDNQLMIAVQDSGRGISAEDQKLLFQSFSQGDPSITRQYGGTGLGLVISKQLTRLMGGDIGFYDNAKENIAKQGSTFWFRMPAQVDVLEAVDQEHLPLPVLAPLANANDEFHLLAWINHPASMQVLKASLRALPINLTQANSLPGVLESLKEFGNRWDWVIVDNDTQDDMMALLKQIRLHYQGKLAVFGYQVSSDQRLLERYQATGLYEPLDKSQLYRMLDTQASKQPQLAPEKRWQGITVLAVDDHLPNLLVLDALLSELGIKVVTVNSGFDAIELMSKQQAALKQQKTDATNDLDIYDNHHQQSDRTAKKGSASTTNALLSNDKKNLQKNSAATSANAIEKHAVAERIDLIFMDIQMPRMSGREAAEQIRKIEDPKHRTPIIALTAHGLSDERDRLIAAGIDDYIGKPISQPQLLQVLQKWLGRTTAGERGNSKGANLPMLTAEQAGLVDTPLEDSTQAVLNQVRKPKSAAFSEKSIDSNFASPESIDMTDKTEALESLPVIDWEDALTRSANKPELAAQLIFMMVDSIEQEKSDLAQAWEDKDRTLLSQIAHRILGASRYAGVPQLRKASQDLEDRCLLNVQHTTPAQFAMLAPSYEALQIALDNLCDVDLSTHPQLSYHKLSEDDMTWKMI
ncbi:ATP-binding protein [Psychrobacter pygoscelis]|uniref:ATP-binding protein n=1 Tax=Psychrobacter pygoscelis TaxID=2488563 RepID=UPI00103C0D02|nr:ATP-binding protein [Psychrobacter pygoscelis]